MSNTMEIGTPEHVYFVITLKTNNIDGAPGLTPTVLFAKNGATPKVAATGTVIDIGDGDYAYLPSAEEVAVKAKCLLSIAATATENPVSREFSVIEPVAKTATLIAGVQLNSQGKLDVNAEADTALLDYDAPTKAEMDAGFAALNDPTALAIAGAVYDVPKAGHVAAGSFGEEIQLHSTSTELAAQNDLSAAQVKAQVDSALDTAIPVTPSADSINERIKAIDDLTQAGGVGDLAAVLTDTGTTLDTKINDMQGATFAGASDSLEAIRNRGDAAWVTGAGGGGGINVVLGAIQTVSNPGNRIASPIKLEMFDSEVKLFPLMVLDAAGSPVDLNGLTLSFVIYDSNDPPNGIGAVSAIAVSGVNSEIATVTVDGAAYPASTEYKWILWDTVSKSALLSGVLEIRPAKLVVP